MAKDQNILKRPGTQASIDAKRDAQGRFTERTIRLGDSLEVRRYAYDSAGRLSRVTNERGALRESYQYDQQGRRLADICPELRRGERRYTYGPGNRLGQAGQVQYGHDRAGFRNLKVEATPQGQRETQYHYEPSGLLLAVELPDGRRIDYAYDASGQRTEKRVNGRIVEAYRWLDGLRLNEFHDGRQWWRLLYGQGRSPVGVENGRERYLILCDQVGTPLALAHLDGSVVQAMQYDSFGNLLQVRGDVVRLPLGFAGGLYDADTGLTRFVWRDFDADTGRFTALDPLGKKGGDKDWYGYCVDDPVNRVDAWGLFWTDTSAGRILKQGAIDGTKGAVAGWRLGAPFGVAGPGIVAGGLVGSGFGMAKQAVLEYPPLKEKTDEWEQTAKDMAQETWESINTVRDDALEFDWSSIYDSSSD